MDLHVSLDGARDLSGQIYRQLRAAVRDGRLRDGEPLPSSRELATRLDVSRNTVSAAYERLAADGLVHARPGVGAFVRAEHPTSTGAPARSSAPTAPLRPRPVWDTVEPPPYLHPPSGEYDLRIGIPSRQHFPYASWRSLLARQLRPSVMRAGGHTEPAGSATLRESIARHVAVSRGARVEPDNVFVTGGTQQALDLAARVLLEPGDTVAVEDPGYAPAAMLFRSLRMRVVGVPVDDDGIVVSAIPDDTRLVYVTPSHQFPLGMSMSTARRRELLDRADRIGATIVEDDYDAEFRYAGRPLEPLQSLDVDGGTVLYVASFSKTLLPTLRLGFVLAPRSLLPAFARAKLVTDLQTSGPSQEALAELIDTGGLARHVRRMRRVYAERHHAIVSILDGEFGDVLRRVPSWAGIHVTALLQPHVTVADTDIVRRARRRGVALSAALSEFGITEPAPPGIVLGYGNAESEQLIEGMRRLRECVA